MGECSVLREAIIREDAAAAVSQTRKLVDQSVKPVDIISDGVTPAMALVGRLFENGECFVPELLMAACATKDIFQIFRPLLAETNARPRAGVLLRTVQGDLYDIGKNLVAAMLEGDGFEVTDLGVDVPPERFIAAQKEKQAHIVGLSALLTSTLPAMKVVNGAFGAAGIRDQVKIMAGGAPVTKRFADTIRADGDGENAIASVDLAGNLAANGKTREVHE